MNALVETRGDDQIQGAQVSEDTVSGDWHYKAEGGAHLIFGYTGSSPAYRGKVLRIRKVSAAGDDAQMAVADEWRDRLLPKLVPSHLLVPAHAVTLSFTFVHELMLSASGVRPAWRKKDQSTAEEDVRAWLLEDLSAVDQGGNNRRTLSIEIKPKWGFLPSPAFLHPPESVPIKSRISRFVMHQHLRDATNSEGKSYDPLDLYSGDEERMQRSLDGLFAGWKSTEGKGNNFRLSVDGVTVFPGQVRTDLHPANLLSALSGPLILSLQSSGALRILRDLQSSLDATDISDLAHRFHLAHPDSDLFDPSLLPDPTPEELSDFVDLYLSAPADGVTEDRWTLRQRLIAYTMSAIFKDCSIFVTIPFTYSGNQLVSTQGDSKVRLIDLDMKPISSLRKWYDLDDQIWRHWLSTHTDGD
ncbi:inositol-pentakisphosphate 2-kinase, partial [Naematelia encephala]